MSGMRAALVLAHGGPEGLAVAEAPRPVPGPGEVLVRVVACALNHLDVFVRRGIPGHELPVPYVPGGDVAGWVESAGDAEGAPLVSRGVLVDPLVDGGALGESRDGGMAEYVVVPAANAIPLPYGDDLIPYAALPIAYGTAYRMLFRRGRLERGETVVVVSASGGVGVACVQLAARAGARVIACSSSAAKLGGLRELGADEVLDTSGGDLARAVRALTGRRGAEMVVDFTGRETWPGSVRALRAGGRLVTCGATSGHDAVTDLRYVFSRELSILGTNGWVREDLETLVELVGRGELRPAIHRVFPLSEAAAAFAELEERRALGKVIVRP